MPRKSKSALPVSRPARSRRKGKPVDSVPEHRPLEEAWAKVELTFREIVECANELPEKDNARLQLLIARLYEEVQTGVLALRYRAALTGLKIMVAGRS